MPKLRGRPLDTGTVLASVTMLSIVIIVIAGLYHLAMPAVPVGPVSPPPVAPFLAILVVLGVAVVVVAVLQPRIRRWRSSDYPDVERSQWTLKRDCEFVEVVNETDDGYGIALTDAEGGVEIAAFENHDEIYRAVWLPPEDLGPVGDGLSARAPETGREQERGSDD